MSTTARQRYSVPALAKAIEIVDVIAQHSEGCRLTDIVNQLGLSKSTVSFILSTLEENAYVRRLPDSRRYVIGLHLFEVGTKYLGQLQWRKEFIGVAQRLVDMWGETIQMAILSGRDVLYIARLEGHQPVRLVSHIGSRLPAHATALGKAMLAFLPSEDIYSLYRERGLEKLTDRTISSLPELVADLEKVRQRGYAIDDQETDAHLRCVAVPIARGGRAKAACSISGLADRMTDERIQEMLVALVEVSHTLSRSIYEAIPVGDFPG